MPPEFLSKDRDIEESREQEDALKGHQRFERGIDAGIVAEAIAIDAKLVRSTRASISSEMH